MSTNRRRKPYTGRDGDMVYLAILGPDGSTLGGTSVTADEAEEYAIHVLMVTRDARKFGKEQEAE
jgi:hypothetical protein